MPLNITSGVATAKAFGFSTKSYKSGTSTFYSGSGTFTVPPSVYSVTLTMIGGGGNGNANGDSAPSSGGGSAAYFSNVVINVTPAQTISYSVGVAGASNSINPAQYDGTDSTFGTLIAGGGRGGHWRSRNTPYPSDERGGEGGTATGTGGVNGTKGTDSAAYGGNGYGASSPYGSGGTSASSGNGGAASGYGAGGGGGGNNSGGGSGSNGFITITW